jgi:excisionase family DNA binding protein
MRVGKANGRDWLRLSEAAAVLGVSLHTLRRWSDTGKPVCYRSPGGHRRYRRADVEALLRAQSREGQPADGASLLPAFAAGDGNLDPLGPPLSLLAEVAADVYFFHNDSYRYGYLKDVNMPELFAGVIVLAVAGIAMTAGFGWIEKRLVPWTKD